MSTPGTYITSQPPNPTHTPDRGEPDSEIPQYILPVLDLPSVLDIDTVVRNCGIDSYIPDSDIPSCSDDNDGFSEDEPEVLYNNNAVLGPLNRRSHLNLDIEAHHQSLSNKPSLLRSKNSMHRSKDQLNRTSSMKSAKDPNLVTWDSAEDLNNPHNWTQRQKWTATLLVSMFTFVSPMASTMVAPALDTIADEYDISSSVEEILVMSIFLLAYAIGPFLWGPLSEVFGRVRVLQGANLIFLLFNTVCGFAKTKQQMMAFRFLSGIGGSAPQAIGGGVLSDCFRADERGTAIAIYSLMPFISPALGPIAGGYITQYATWRWVFWATSIFDGLIQILAVLFLKETYTPALLNKKMQRLRKETGNQDLRTKWNGPEHTMKQILMKSLVRPFIMLGTQPALQAMALYRAYLYGLMYLVLATFPRVFEEMYNQDTGRASLNYLSLGIGFVIGLQITGPLQDKVYAYCKLHQINPCAPIFCDSTWKLPTEKSLLPPKEATQHSDFAIPRRPIPRRTRTNRSFTYDHTKSLPEYRLPLTLPSSLFIPIGLFMYGWSSHNAVCVIVPNIGAAIFAAGLIVAFNCAQAYVVDTYTTYAASATGAAAFVRTMAGFSFPLFAPAMYDKLGLGWGNSLLGFLSLGVGLVAPLMLWRFGAWLRARSLYCAG